MFEPAGNLHVQELQAQHETFKNTTLKEGDGYYEALNGLAEQLAAASTSENPYTGHTPQVGGMVGDTGGPHAERWGVLALVHCSGCPLQSVYDKWCSVLECVPQREAALQSELQRQQCILTPLSLWCVCVYV